MTCNVWVSNELQDDYYTLKSGELSRAGQKITVPNKTICRADFYLKKYSVPTGSVYARIRKVSDDSIIETSGDVLDITTVTTSFEWYSFTFDSVVDEEVYICVEYTQGVATRALHVGIYLSNVIIGAVASCCPWSSASGWDCTIRIYEEVVGVDHTKTVAEILGLVDSHGKKADFQKAVSEKLGLVDVHDKDRCDKCPPSSVILVF